MPLAATRKASRANVPGGPLTIRSPTGARTRTKTSARAGPGDRATARSSYPRPQPASPTHVPIGADRRLGY